MLDLALLHPEEFFEQNAGSVLYTLVREARLANWEVKFPRLYDKPLFARYYSVRFIKPGTSEADYIELEAYFTNYLASDNQESFVYDVFKTAGDYYRASLRSESPS